MELIVLLTRKEGAVVVDHLNISNIDEINEYSSVEYTALEIEFKVYLNAYLKELVTSKVRSLADVIDFNNKNSELVSTLVSNFS